jgi:hypothetical protein
VVKPGEKYELIAMNDLGEKFFASPAISGGHLFLRSAQNVYCIGAAEK